MEFIKQFETDYPNLSENFKKIQREQYELFARKNLDYGMSNIALGADLEIEENRSVSLSGLWFRIMDKVARLKNLIVLKRTANVGNEGADDTLIDVSNYGIIALLVLRNLWKK